MPLWPKIAQPGGHMFTEAYIGKHEKIFFPETTRPKALIFGMCHHLVDLYQVSSNYAPWVKRGPPCWVHMFNIGLIRENIKKSSFLKPLGL